ncbi:MAG: phosphatidate cytidylyltransferase [Lysobacterales bacterium]
MLKLRVLTALLLLPLVMVAIFALPAQWFLILLAIVLLGGSWEYVRLAGVSGRPEAYGLVALQAVIFGVLFWYRNAWAPGIVWYLSICCAAWLVLFIRLPVYQQDALPDSQYRAISMASAILSVTSCWFALGWLRFQPEGSWLILLLLLIVWAADTGAYFAGRAFGKRKLAPRISPGKTQAGLLGGLALAVLIAMLATRLMPFKIIEPVGLVLLTLVTALVSVGGDLMISMHKRTSGFKDSGSILPGHGGILDRVDSLLAAAPFFALGLLVAGF